MLAAILILFVLAMLAYRLASRLRIISGLTAGRVIFSDPKTWGAVEKPLVAPEFKLTGKPDHILKQGNRLIPVEVKSRPLMDAPYESHILQLAAYCLLVESHYGTRPHYGLLHYPNRTMAINYTSALERRLKDLLEQMKSHSDGVELNRSHNSHRRCQACGFRQICDQALI
mgnify:CR=1 FL=1